MNLPYKTNLPARCRYFFCICIRNILIDIDFNKMYKMTRHIACASNYQLYYNNLSIICFQRILEIIHAASMKEFLITNGRCAHVPRKLLSEIITDTNHVTVLHYFARRVCPDETTS